MSFRSLQAAIYSSHSSETLNQVIDAMIGNAPAGTVNPKTVLAAWESAKDVEDVYLTPYLGLVDPDGTKIRKLTKAELKELDGYIADARALFPETPNFEQETRRLHEGLKTLPLKEEEFLETELAAAGYTLDDTEDDVLIAPKEFVDAAANQIARGDKFGAAIEYLTTLKVAKAVVQERAKALEIAAEKS